MLKELVIWFNINIGYSCLRYLGYIINLIIKALLFSKGISKLKQKLAGVLYNKVFKNWNSIGPISKLYNIYIYINYNLIRIITFKEC